MHDEYGYFLVSRKQFESGEDPLWEEDRELSRWEAWIDMLQRAKFKPGIYVEKGYKVELNRGEFLASLRQLGRDWGWGTRKVRNFLDWATAENRVSVVTETHLGTVYRVVKYASYQPSLFGGDTGPNDDSEKKGHSTPSEEGHSKGHSQGTHYGRMNDKQRRGSTTGSTDIATSGVSKKSTGPLSRTADEQKVQELLQFGPIQAIKKAAWEVSVLRDGSRNHVWNKHYDEGIREVLPTLGAEALVQDMLSLKGKRIKFPLDYCLKAEPGKRESRWRAAMVEKSRMNEIEDAAERQRALASFDLNEAVERFFGQEEATAGDRSEDRGGQRGGA